jgi:hypothetical protein
MNAYWMALARRNWQVLAALLVFLVAGGVHAAVFRPLV